MNKLPPPSSVAAALVACALAVLPPATAGPTRPVVPTPLGVNSPADEDEPLVVGNTLYFTCNAKGKFDLMTATRRNPVAAWGRPRLIEDVRTEADDRGAFPFTDREGFQYLYFATKKDKDTDNYDIYVAQRLDAKHAYSSPTPVNSVDSSADEMHPWLTVDGKQLYFSRKTKQGWRVMVAAREKAAGGSGFGEPAFVEELPAGYHHATLTPDGKTMYFQGPLAKGRWGLFRSTKSSGKWGEPEELTTLNGDGAKGDVSPCLSREGNQLYFASDRTGSGAKGGLDLYSVSTVLLVARK